MRRLVIAVTAGLIIVLVALLLRTSSSARFSNETNLPSRSASPIDPPSTIVGTVFEDANSNGEQEAAEPGIADVTVKLRNSIQGTITTDPNGDYSFSLAWDGYYTVTAMTPAGYAATTPESIVAHITGPDEQVRADFGYRGIGSILGTVFDDRNINGIQDGGEPGVSGVRITLLQDGSAISTTTTGGDGTYAFSSLFLGNYTVEETNPPGYTSTTPNAQPVTLTTPNQEAAVDFGDYGPSRVTGIVFNDLDGDGVQDGDERGISGVTVDLLDDDVIQATKTTDDDGVYFFLWDDLGDYTVQETNLEGYISTSDDQVEITKDEPGQVEIVNFADRGIGIIHGTVFDDQNGNRALDGGEPGIEAVTIDLLQDDTVIRSGTTDSDGDYEFAALGLGPYTVRETDPDGYDSTTTNAVTTTLTTTRQAAEVSFADRGVGTIRGTVFGDLDGDGAQDVGEPGIDGVVVTLLQEGSTIRTSTTSDGGSYEFDRVWLGEYTVQETDMEGYVSTSDNVVTVSLTTPQQMEVRNFGDRGIGTIAGTVFSDDDGSEEHDGEEQGIANVTVTLLQEGSTVSTTTTTTDGSYAFASLLLGDYTVQATNPDGYVSTTDDEVDVVLTTPGQQETVNFGDRPVGAIEGTVFSDENGNGVQDGGEQGIQGVTVALLREGTTTGTVTTSASGTYAFDPLWLDDYTVLETNPVGYVSTTDDQVTISLTTPGQRETVDFGDQTSLFYLPMVARNYP